jgi:hypothetical protein
MVVKTRTEKRKGVDGRFIRELGQLHVKDTAAAHFDLLLNCFGFLPRASAWGRGYLG